MELVPCPVCGCRVQVADTLLGQRIRCIGCDHRFIAAPDRPASPYPPPQPSPTRGEGEPLSPSPAGQAAHTQQGEGWGGGGEADAADGDGRPFCPGCGRRIGWDASRCPACGEEFELEEDAGRWRRRVANLIRRDYEPHRGSLILSLGNLGLIVGGLSLCLFGLGAILSIPIGIVVWLMAGRDLEYMSAGRMDPAGKRETETGRTLAVVGIILGLVSAAFYAVCYLAS